MTHALLPIVAQNFGAKKFDRVREALFLCLKIGIVSMCLCYPLIWFFSGSILRVFTNDQEVIEIGIVYLRVDGLILPIYAVIFSLNSFLQGLKRPYGVFIVGLFRQGFGIAFFIWIFINVFNFGILGVWLGAGVSVILGGLLSVWIAKRVAKSEIGGLSFGK